MREAERAGGSFIPNKKKALSFTQNRAGEREGSIYHTLLFPSKNMRASRREFHKTLLPQNVCEEGIMNEHQPSERQSLLSMIGRQLAPHKMDYPLLTDKLLRTSSYCTSHKCLGFF